MIERYALVSGRIRHVYTFNFDPERIERLVERLRPCFERIQVDLLAFAEFMEGLASGEE